MLSPIGSSYNAAISEIVSQNYVWEQILKNFDRNYKYRDSPVSAVFWSPANRTIGKTALIEHWFSSKIAIWDFCDFKVHFFSSFSVNIIFWKWKNWLLGLFWHDHWVIYDQFLLLYIIYATFKLDDYVLSTVVTKSKLEALVFIAP